MIWRVWWIDNALSIVSQRRRPNPFISHQPTTSTMSQFNNEHQNLNSQLFSNSNAKSKICVFKFFKPSLPIGCRLSALFYNIRTHWNVEEILWCDQTMWTLWTERVGITSQSWHVFLTVEICERMSEQDDWRMREKQKVEKKQGKLCSRHKAKSSKMRGQVDFFLFPISMK